MPANQRSTRYATWCTCRVCEHTLPKKNAASMSQNGAPRTASPSVVERCGARIASVDCGNCPALRAPLASSKDAGTIHNTQIAASTRTAARQP